MAKYRKRPVVIEAFQMTKERRANNVDWPEWLNKAWNGPMMEVGFVWPHDYPKSDGTDQIVIGTLEGNMLVGWGDWIIQGVDGELYPCKPHIFKLTYEEVVDGND